MVGKAAKQRYSIRILITASYMISLRKLNLAEHTLLDDMF